MKLTKTLIALALAGAAFSAQAHKPWLLHRLRWSTTKTLG